MVDQSFDVIIGIHSIQAALLNDHRTIEQIVGTQESLKNLKGLSQDKVKVLGSHEVQEKGKEFAKKIGYQLSRIPSNVFVVASPLKVFDISFLNSQHQKILCLDSVSDIHNAAAIMRTADFFGIDAIVIPQKKSFGLSPAFYRLASGATETLPIVRVSSLAKFVRKIKEEGYPVVGLSEHAEQKFQKPSQEKAALIVGAEDVGLSYVVSRECDQLMALKSQGTIQSLNVSVATALALEKCFGS